MASAKADRWGTRVDVVPVVIVLGDTEVAGVFRSVAVAVSDQVGLPVVVDVAVRDGDVVSSMGELGKPLVKPGLFHTNG